MKLSELTHAERKKLAEDIDSSSDYIYQLATNRRKPSVDFSKKINKADPRFTLPELRPDIWGVEATQ